MAKAKEFVGKLGNKEARAQLGSQLEDKARQLEGKARLMGNQLEDKAKIVGSQAKKVLGFLNRDKMGRQDSSADDRSWE